MKKFTQELLTKIKSDIDNVVSKGLSGFELYNSCFLVARKAFAQLKKFIIDYEFKNEEEEIEFFKDVKPFFHAELLYYKELIQIEMLHPSGSNKKELIKYYRSLYYNYQLSLKKYELSMYYLRAQVEDSDQVLFLRSRQESELIITDIVDLDIRFSTPGSMEIGRIKAYEMILEYVNNKIEFIKHGDSLAVNNSENNKSTLTWTGDKIALIELAYALHASKMINEGKAQIRFIALALETAFNTQLSGLYRAFQDIRMQKFGRVSFIEELHDSLLKRINDKDQDRNLQIDPSE